MPHRTSSSWLSTGCSPFELGIPQRIFGRSIGTEADGTGRKLYDVVTCSIRPPGPVRPTRTSAVLVEHGPEALATADTAVIPASTSWARSSRRQAHRGAGRRARPRPARDPDGLHLHRQLRPWRRPDTSTAAPATTHWSSADHFQRIFPQVRVDPDVLFIDDGDVPDLRRGSRPGSTSACTWCGATTGRPSRTRSPAARWCPRTGTAGQAQHIHRPLPEPQFATTTAARAWALARLDRPILLRDMAEQEAMSVRTFTRRFREGGRDQPPASGSPSSGWSGPATCWSRQTCPSTRWPGTRASARRPRCASTSRRPWACRRRSTGVRSGRRRTPRSGRRPTPRTVADRRLGPVVSP